MKLRTRTYCEKCKHRTVFESGVALMNPVTSGLPDFPGDKGDHRGQTLSPDLSRALAIHVLKCQKCGHSFQLEQREDDND